MRVRAKARARARARAGLGLGLGLGLGWAVDLRADAAILALGPASGHLSQAAVLVSPHRHPVRILGPQLLRLDAPAHRGHERARRATFARQRLQGAER